MKNRIRVLLAAAAVVAVVLSVRYWVLPAYQRGAEPVAPVSPEASPERDPSALSAVPSSGSVVGESVEDSARRQVEGAAAASVEDEEVPPPRSLVVAHVTDDRGAALAGAWMRVVKRDGRDASIAPTESSASDGVVTLALEDDDLRTWRGEVYRMHFAVSAPEHGTRFIVGTPKRRDTRDLGVIELQPGAIVRGRVIDGAGAGIAGASVAVCELALEHQLELMQINGPDPDVPRLRVTAGADGRFEFPGVPAGELRLAGHSSEMLWIFTDPFPVQAGAVVDAPPIVLVPVPAASLAVGVVVDPRGVPVAGVDVHYSGGLINGSSGDTTSDVAGRFSIPTTKESLELRAIDETGGHGASVTTTWHSGDEELILRLTERRPLIIRVDEDDGGPVEGASVLVLGAADSPMMFGGGSMLMGNDWNYTDAEGRVTVSVPPEPFRLSVGTDLHEYSRPGPFDPGTVFEEIRVTLARKALLEGVVFGGGEPIPGARLEVCQVLVGYVEKSMGFALRMFGNGQWAVTADESGRFAVPPQSDWTEAVLLATADGWAITEQRVSFPAGEGLKDIELVLTRGGTIEGTVTAPPGRNPAGIVVAASRGDGYPRSVRTDEEGRYRLEHLTPGDWRVETRENEPTADVMSIEKIDEDTFGWNVVVFEGRVTRHDLDRRLEALVLFDGRLTLGGRPAVGWGARVKLPDYQRPATALPTAVLDEAGGFQLSLSPGDYEIELRSPDGTSPEFEVLRTLKVVGPAMSWSEDVAVGALSGELDDGPLHVRLFHGNTQEGSWERVTFQVGASGEFDVDVVPAGECSFQHEVDGSYGLGWYGRGSVTIEAGGKNEFQDR